MADGSSSLCLCGSTLFEAFLEQGEEGAQGHGFAADGAAGAGLGVPGHHVEMRPGRGLGDEFGEEQRRGYGAAQGAA